MEGYLREKTVGNKTIGIEPMTFGKARITVGPVGGYCLDDAW